MRRFLLLLFFLPLITIAQQKKLISLEDIYKTRTFRNEPVTADFGIEKKDPVVKDLKDEFGKAFDPEDIIYSSSYPNIVLVRRSVEPIYRRSSKAFVYLYDALSKKLTKLD